MRHKRHKRLIHREIVLCLAIIVFFAVTLVGLTVGQASSEPLGWAESSNSTTKRSMTWYLAEGATSGGLETWIQLQNPGERVAGVTLTFHTDRGPVDSVLTEVGANAEVSINMGDFVHSYSVSTLVESDRPIVASWTIYDSDREWTSKSTGSNQTRKKWQFTEGAAVGSTCETWILLYNPGDRPTVARVFFHTDRGVVGPLGFELGERRRVSVNMGDHVSGFGVTTVIESDMPIVAASTTYGVTGPVDPRVRVVGVAHGQLGKPYSHGAAGPDAFDCSGLTQYCYMVGAGISIPHASYAQANSGTPVALDDLKPGDIVSFHGWGHVGIYIGDGKYIHAPQSGEVVKISLLSEREDYCGAVRPQ